MTERLQVLLWVRGDNLRLLMYWGARWVIDVRAVRFQDMCVWS